MLSKLFEPSSIGTLGIKNRFVRSATWEGLASEDGSCTSRLVDVIAEIQQTVDAFAAAAVRAKAADFDGVQIHAAHGYLISQFLSPYYNKRQDGFGGSVEHRARIVSEILGQIKSMLGNDFPVLIKMNSQDFIDGGLIIEDMLQIARLLEETGIDAFELSGGTADGASQFKPVRQGRLPSEEKEVFYRDAAKRYKETIEVPLILVGGIRSYSVAQELVDEGVADFVSLSRPLIREPRLVARWRHRFRRFTNHRAASSFM